MRPLGNDEKFVMRKNNCTPGTVDLFTGRMSWITLISESGLYKLVMRSDKPEARKIQDWVTKDVIYVLDLYPSEYRRLDMTRKATCLGRNKVWLPADSVLSTWVVEIETQLPGSNILATTTEDGKCFFSPRHVCQALGISWATQFVKIKADQVLGPVVVEIETTASDGKNYKNTMLPIEFLSGWLFTIKKVAPKEPTLEVVSIIETHLVVPVVKIWVKNVRGHNDGVSHAATPMPDLGQTSARFP